MKSGKVTINELRLRIAGLSPADARRLGETVARRLADQPPRRSGAGWIPRIDVRVRSPRSATVEGMADSIAAGIRRSAE